MVSVLPPVAQEKGMMPFCGAVGQGFPGMDRIGNRWTEAFCRWSDLEPKRGEYKFKDLSKIHAKGMKAKLVLAHFPAAPAWSWDPEEVAECKRMQIKTTHSLLPSEARMADWRNFIAKFAAQLKGQVDIIEVGGEDDLTFGGNPYYLKKYPQHAKSGKLVGGPAHDRYAEMIRIACEEIRKADPDVKIGIVRPSGGDCTDIKPQYAFSSPVIKRCGALFDLFPLDCYCWPRNLGPGQPVPAVPEDFLADDLNKALETCRVNGNGQRVYISEIGYALDYTTAPDGEYAMDMVKRLARMFLVARMTPGCESIHWFSTNFCIESGKYHYGLWRFGMPLPSVPAYSAVARIVENVVESKDIAFSGDSKAVVFRKNGRADAAVWFVQGDGKLSFKNLPAGISITDVMGNPVTPKTDGLSFWGKVAGAMMFRKPSASTSVVEVGEFPVYFGLEGANSFDALRKTLEQAKMTCKPVKTSLLTPRGDTGKLQLKNQAGEDIEAKISIAMDDAAPCDKAIKLKKDEKRVVDLPLLKTPATVKIVVDCGEAFEKVEASYPVAFERCARVKFQGKVDGDISKWAGHPCIEMKERSQIMPPDPWIDYKGPEHFSAKVYTGWDDKYLYLAAEVRDDVHTNKYASELWKGDCLQFAIDPKLDAASLDAKPASYGKDDVEIGLALTDKGASIAQWSGDLKAVRSAKYAVTRDEQSKKTVYEVRIPLASLGIKPDAGSAFGFNFVITNDDTGAGANYWYQLTPGIAGGKNPVLFKKFVLER